MKMTENDNQQILYCDDNTLIHCFLIVIYTELKKKLLDIQGNKILLTDNTMKQVNIKYSK